MWHSTFGDYDKVGKVNLMKKGAKGLTKIVKPKIKDDSIYLKIEETAIDIGDLCVSGKGVYKGSIIIAKKIGERRTFSTAGRLGYGIVRRYILPASKTIKRLTTMDITFNLKCVYDDVKNIFNTINPPYAPIYSN